MIELTFFLINILFKNKTWQQYDSNSSAKVTTKGYKLVLCKATVECNFILLSFALAVYIRFTTSYVLE